MLLQRANKVFASPDWVYEPKWDGFRVLASVRDGAVRLIWRNGASFTNLFGPITDALRGFPTSVVLDGEVICINDKGQPDFEALPGCCYFSAAAYWAVNWLTIGMLNVCPW